MLIKMLHHRLHLIGQISHYLRFHRFRNPPNGFSDTPDDGSKRIGISTESNGLSDCILKRCALPNNPESHRNRTLASFIEAVDNIFILLLTAIQNRNRS